MDISVCVALTVGVQSSASKARALSLGELPGGGGGSRVEARGLMSRPDLGCTSTPSWTSPLLSAAVHGLPSRSARPPSGSPAGCLLWLPAGGLPAQGELPTQTPPPPPTPYNTRPPRNHVPSRSPRPCPSSCPHPVDPGFFKAVLPPHSNPQLDSSPLLCLASALLTDPSTPLSQSTNPELPPRLGPVPSGLPQKGTQVRGVKAGPRGARRSVEGEQC